jgi:hypothetical protein
MIYVNETGLGATSGTVYDQCELSSTPTGGVAASRTSFFGMAQTKRHRRRRELRTTAAIL